VTTRDRDVRLHAQRLPDLAWRDSGREGLSRGPTADSRQDEVVDERSPRRTELIGDGALELAVPHAGVSGAKAQA